MDEETFRQLFPITANKELAEQMGVSVTSVIRRARTLGLEKDAEYLLRLRQERGHRAVELMRERGAFPKGENHPNWKGGKPWKRFADPRYIEWRNAVLERDKYICQRCYRQCKKYEKGLAAHHLKSYKDFPEFRYDVNNGLTLCRKCHMEIHGRPMQVQMVECACGCGTLIENKDPYGRRPRQYVNFHAPSVIFKEHPRPSRAREHEGEMIPCACGCGEMITKVGAGGKLRTHVHGHKSKARAKKVIPDTMIPCECGCGTMVRQFSDKGELQRYARGHNVRLYYQHDTMPQAIRDKLSEAAKRRHAEQPKVPKPVKPVDLISCACGCGTMIPSRDQWGRKRRFVNRHGRRTHGRYIKQQQPKQLPLI